MGSVTPIRRRAKGSGVAFEPPPSKVEKPYRRETAAEIAARIRAGMGPTRPIVQRCVERRDDEVWL